MIKVETLSWSPSKESCKKCKVSKCVLSYSWQNTKQKWLKDFIFYDARAHFAESLKDRIAETYGFKVNKIRPYIGTHVWIKPSKKGEVTLLVPQDELLKMIHTTSKSEGVVIADGYGIQVRTPEKIKLKFRGNEVVLQKCAVVPKDLEKEFFVTYWRKNSNSKIANVFF